MNDHLLVLQERYKWLAARIEAKKKVGWETQWDEREHAALGWAISTIKREREGLKIAAVAIAAAREVYKP